MYVYFMWLVFEEFHRIEPKIILPMPPWLLADRASGIVIPDHLLKH